MIELGGFTQEQLNKMWDSIGTKNNSYPAEKIIDEATRQVMTIPTSTDQVAVTRHPEGTWSDTKSQADESIFK
ncbi:MAG: hypothetical protein ACKE51_02645 [Methylococcaceae bacterium]